MKQYNRIGACGYTIAKECRDHDRPTWVNVYNPIRGAGIYLTKPTTTIKTNLNEVRCRVNQLTIYCTGGNKIGQLIIFPRRPTGGRLTNYYLSKNNQDCPDRRPTACPLSKAVHNLSRFIMH